MTETHELQNVGKDHGSSAESRRNYDRDTRDDQVLTRLGKRPVLKRNFGLLSMLGFSCTVMITWEGILILLSNGLTNGGLAGSVYGYIIVWVGTITSFSTMAELSSMAPTAAGQYHWVSILAPKSTRVFLSYIIGWLTMIGWQGIVASGGFLTAQLTQGLITLNDGDYTAEPWQAVLLFWATIISSVLFNTVIAPLLPKVESFILVVHVFGFFAVLVPLLYFAPRDSASDVFTSFSNGGNFPTQGLSVMVGLLGPAFALLGPDGVVHMSEEVENPAKNVPRAMVFGIFLNGALGFGMLVAALFCLGAEDLSTTLATPTDFPFMAMFQQAVGSTPGALTMAAIVTIMTVASSMSFVATASRMTWSFARDRGIPAWRTLKLVESRSTLPLWSIALTCVISILLSLIILGSSVAFNDVISLSINGLYSSYLIGNSLLLWRRLTGQIQPYSSQPTMTNTPDSEQLTWGPWKIPEPFGTIGNAIGCIYLFVVLLFSFWPTVNNPTAETMNYSCLMVGAVIIFSVLYYVLYAKQSFTGPVVEVNCSEQGGSLSK